MPKGHMTCKICHGKGTLTENAMEYEFITRDPITSTCLICSGKGWVASRSKLPDGTPARKLIHKDQVSQAQNTLQSRIDRAGGLNVSRKATLGTPISESASDPRGLQGFVPARDKDADLKTGYLPPRPQRHSRDLDLGTEPGIPTVKFWYTHDLPERLNKVLASNKQFLIVTETEPYYLDVFRLIRAQERAQDTWSPEDEENYIQALEQTIQTYKEASNG